MLRSGATAGLAEAGPVGRYLPKRFPFQADVGQTRPRYGHKLLADAPVAIGYGIRRGRRKARWAFPPCETLRQPPDPF